MEIEVGKTWGLEAFHCKHSRPICMPFHKERLHAKMDQEYERKKKEGKKKRKEGGKEEMLNK